MARMDRYKKKSDMTAPPLRAAFPEERQQFFQQQPENYVPYPDQV